MRNAKAMIAGFLAGMASPINVFEAREQRRLKGDDLSRMRGDIERVGADFTEAIGSYEKKNHPTPARHRAHTR